MKLSIEGKNLSKEDVIVIGQFLTDFMRDRVDVLEVWVSEGTEDMSAKEVMEMFVNMMKKDPEFKTIFEVRKDD